ncbi:phosphatidylserine synthase 2-like [Lingula anatina]|uniref:Phosphatidylserine synthase n=1 Tax=Lingula anatina TaxID=7574 RepID=A0A1S3IYU7_LINAN|nr:phosphatidylserine synthase 2-like [Lingula anatina]|eukprot:XP_013403377.1 phosphatidylserine synthase 2-like [Lingula anatina]
MIQAPAHLGRLQRVASQFTPYSWMDFDWRPTFSLKRWLAMLGIIIMFLAAELNTFYLKFVLWIPPEHYLCLGRLVFFLFAGAVAMREAFQFLDDPNCKKFGRQAWMIAAIIITELLIVLKFDWQTVSKPIPFPVACFWILGIVGLFVYTIWKFYLHPHKVIAKSHQTTNGDVVMNNNDRKTQNKAEGGSNGSVSNSPLKQPRFRVSRDSQNGKS